MTMVGLFQFCIRTLSETVNYLTNIERILSYTQMEQEKDNNSNGTVMWSVKYSRTLLNKIFIADLLVPRIWPSEGYIEFRNLNFRYSNGGRLVLQNINLNILGLEKVDKYSWINHSLNSSQAILNNSRSFF